MTLDRRRAPSDCRRYSRQICLVDVGEAGQAKLCATAISLVTEGFARTIEERYVRAAGMRILQEPYDSSRGAVNVAALGLRHGSARELGEGALAALEAIRSTLGFDASRTAP